MKSTQAVWDQSDKVWAEVDKLWIEVDKLWAGLDTSSTDKEVKPVHVHHIRFKARSFGERWRMLGQFFRLGLRILFHGESTLNFKQREDQKYQHN